MISIKPGSKVTIDFTLKDDKGNFIDYQEGFEYIQGSNEILEPLQDFLLGKVPGDKIRTLLKAPYGEYTSDLLSYVPRQVLKDIKPTAGQQFIMVRDEKQMFFTVVAVEPDRVLLDNNHPLASVNLEFSIQVTAVNNKSDKFN